MSSQLPANFTLPDLASLCPFSHSSSPHYEKAGAESAAWVNSFNFFSGRKRAIFMQTKSELLVSRVYSYAGYEEFRTCCDFVNALFVLDEISDEQSGGDARNLGSVFLAALGGKPCDNSALTRMAQEFNSRFGENAAKNCRERFATYCANYIDAVGREAELREAGVVLDSGAYMNLRRENSAIRPCFGLFEYICNIDLPNTVFEDPVFTRLYWAAADMVCLSNDLYSYNMERLRGLAGNNIVTVLMKENNQSLQDAIDHVADWFRSLLDQYIADKPKLPSFGASVDEAVQKYLFCLENWVKGNLVWSFETPRYFGPDFREVKKTLVVKVQSHDFY